jgi:serine/threonine protein kinase
VLLLFYIKIKMNNQSQQAMKPGMKSNEGQKQVKSASKGNDDYEIPIGDTYKLNARRKLGSGAFGDIYLGVNLKLNEEVAIKLESTKSRHPQLFYEGKLYMALQGGSK